MVKSTFKEQRTFEKRKADAASTRAKYPDRVPVIVEKAEKSDVPDIDRKKYLVPSDMTLGHFVHVIRKRINLSAEKAMFMFVDNVLPAHCSVGIDNAIRCGLQSFSELELLQTAN
uniref:Autophagy-related protein n=1 Tax=Ananas comosus var. bracteatus TaxID=296719 RepID=A0A6V7NJG6_ANACO|nr:unnamed protein product [Ananas comosus var. bracteatus]